jgi:hypothetical protein
MQPHSISRFHFVCASEHQQFRGLDRQAIEGKKWQLILCFL